jgi:uncharacterized membrane protein
LATRRPYLDWLRGVGVLVMIQAHVIDAWTQESGRESRVYEMVRLVGGIGGAPLFLFLAGVALAFAAGRRVRAGLAPAGAAARASARGWQIFGLALLFRLQSWILGGGDPLRILAVDVLNVMGLAMVVSGSLWGMGRTRSTRGLLLGIAAVIVAFSTPLWRASEAIAVLWDPVESYLRPAPGTLAFSLFPWMGFVFAGSAAGVWLESAATAREERVAIGVLTGAGLALAFGGYAASFLPPLYPQSDYWTSSPAFFCVRLGLVVASLSLAHTWTSRAGGRWSPVANLGRSSLLVYWVHVELAYGVVSLPLHGRLPIGAAALGVILVSLLMYAVVESKSRWFPWLTPFRRLVVPA